MNPIKIPLNHHFPMVTFPPHQFDGPFKGSLPRFRIVLPTAGRQYLRDVAWTSHVQCFPTTVKHRANHQK